MSRRYGAVAFTDDVAGVRTRHGSRAFHARHEARRCGSEDPDALTGREEDFLAGRDGFYLATTSTTGWPYVQYRGGPPGFLRVIDDHTLGWADFRGNLQYISTGNLVGNDRMAVIAMDYPARRRLKLFGHAQAFATDDEPDLAVELADPAHEGPVEHVVLVSVVAFDWNCPRHITPRYTAAEIQALLAPVHQQLADAQAENAELRRRIARTTNDDEETR